MLTFGRQADLCVDSGNPLLHPEMGRFEHRTGLWWLVNTGRDIWIELHDLEAESWVPLAPGREIAISTPRTAVRFSAGPADYELDVSLGPV